MLHDDDAERLKTQFPGPLSGEERRCLEDLRALLDFVLDNNLSIQLVWDTFGHDYEEVGRAGFDLHKALASGFWPKTRNFSHRGD
ncbi:MAG: hypothetical protein GX575_21670 [Candidatus Anammoximicrobium sp.]|nr:hypothetical protein [Candidatus Anammoximicrobium sp.]